MKFLHTADWHIGNLFHEFDRTYEHQQFLDWLNVTLIKESVDVLLISGDVFDISNPSAASLKMFYHFLKTAIDQNPSLQIIITAGNHDSASRLEVARPLVNDQIHMIGIISRNEEGDIDYNSLVIPLKQESKIKGYCIAVPFLRAGDHPEIPECSNPYPEGIKSFYHNAFDAAAKNLQEDQFIIALGHLHAMNAEISEHDINERAIMGGVECIASDAFHPGICYVALGHIHKAQRIGGKEHIRYSGSPIPMSFSEINYQHQVICFEVEENQAFNIRSIAVPVSVPLHRIPVKHAPLHEVLTALENLEEGEELTDTTPYLQVQVLLEGPEPGLKYKVDTALKNKNVRLTRIDVRYRTSKTPGENEISHDQLRELQPKDIFTKLFENKYKVEVPWDMLQLFNQAADEVNMKED
jgi:exonuclease SbcD